ncbi:MAG: type II secretion system F family protein [bacterium]
MPTLALSSLQRSSYRILGPFASTRFRLDKIHKDLARARIPIRAEAYVAFSLACTVLTFVVALFLSGFAGLVLLPQMGVPFNPIILLAVFVVPFLFSGVMYAIFLTSPASRAKSRAKNLEAYLPYALNYIAAMASAGVPAYEVFRSLATQPIYGQISTEARWIAKDVFLGMDIITAMKRAADRSPTDKWSEVLQGAITTVTSGGDLKGYFAQKADRFSIDNRQIQRQFVEIMGLMAETYVTAAVAGPLFMIVMLSIMAMLGSGEPGILYLIVYLVLPMVNGAFAMGLVSMSPKV